MVKVSFLVLLALAPADECGALRQDEPITRGPYLQALLDTSVEVHWRSRDPVRGRVVCELPGGANRVAEEEAPETVHRLKLTGLAPGAVHEYRIFHDGAGMTDPAFRFRAAPPAGEEPIRAAVIGDSGSGGEFQKAVAELMQGLRPDLFLHTGDLDYTANPDCAIFEPYRKLLPSSGFFPVRGNHDLDLDWPDLFRPPNPGGPGGTFFAFDWGSAHFVALDTELPLTFGSEQRIWLVAELEAARARKLPWTILYCHVPVYTVGLYAGSADVLILRALLGPIIDKYGVDLVLTGHDHNYQRSHPVWAELVRDAWQGPDAYIFPRGTIYLVTGGGGNGLYPELTQSDHRYTERFVAEYHVLELIINSTRLRARAIALDPDFPGGRVIDDFTIRKDGPRPVVSYLRGDADLSGDLGLTDAIAILLHLFQGGVLECPPSADVDGSVGDLNLADAVVLLQFLFLGGDPPPAPFPACAADPEAFDAFCMRAGC